MAAQARRGLFVIAVRPARAVPFRILDKAVGGKAPVATLVWRRFGRVANYVEPFFGSGAMLLARPSEHFDTDGARTETVNDLDGMVANFWRALAADPAAVLLGRRAAARPLPAVDFRRRPGRAFVALRGVPRGA